MTKQQYTKAKRLGKPIVVGYDQMTQKKPRGSIVVQDRKRIADSARALRKCLSSVSQYTNAYKTVASIRSAALVTRPAIDVSGFVAPEDQSFLIGAKGDVIGPQRLETGQPSFDSVPAMRVGTLWSGGSTISASDETPMVQFEDLLLIRTTPHGTMKRPASSGRPNSTARSNSTNLTTTATTIHAYLAEFVQYDGDEAVLYLADCTSDWNEQFRFNRSDMPRSDMSPGDRLEYRIFKINGVVQAQFLDRIPPTISQADLDAVDAHVDALLGDHFFEPDVT